MEPVQTRILREEIEAIGSTHANESVTISAKVTDTISRVRFEDGDLVAKGDILVELTNDEQTALLAESDANVRDARAQYNRKKDLLTQNVVPVSEVDTALATLNAVEARYQSIVARLDDRLIRAPFAGVLGFRQVSAGTLLTQATAITTLDDISTIKLDFSIPEVHLSLVEPGMNLVARSSAFPDLPFPATVRTIGTRVDEATRTATIRAHIANPTAILRPGMLMTVILTTSERVALMVPDTAIVRRSNDVWVYVIGEDNSAELRPISPGVRYKSWVEVMGGLTEGEQVVSAGVIKLRDGMKVRITSESSRPSVSAAQQQNTDS
ncbi:MAG: efflux RND transporter periplasmic adaptor subunit [Proteobacteria bacterium]|nr:efflux RND transporter periplasmic adaptor subunit [Pseudomonadota bacterium]